MLNIPSVLQQRSARKCLNAVESQIAFYMYMYHHLTLPIKKRKLFSYVWHILEAVVKIIKLNEGAKGMSRLEITKLRKWMFVLILCIGLYVSTVSISHNWYHREVIKKETDFYVKFVQSANEAGTQHWYIFIYYSMLTFLSQINKINACVLEMTTNYEYTF